MIEIIIQAYENGSIDYESYVNLMNKALSGEL